MDIKQSNGVNGHLQKNSILFVCLGNTCRSPMAEAIFKSLLKSSDNNNATFNSSDWTVDSAGTRDYHVGKNPNPSTMKVLNENGIWDFKHKARQIEEDDFHKFELIICMDKWNERDLMGMRPSNSRAKLHRLGEFMEKEDQIRDVYDPYFDGNDAAFYSVYDHCLEACSGLLKRLREGRI